MRQKAVQQVIPLMVSQFWCIVIPSMNAVRKISYKTNAYIWTTRKVNNEIENLKGKLYKHSIQGITKINQKTKSKVNTRKNHQARPEKELTTLHSHILGQKIRCFYYHITVGKEIELPKRPHYNTEKAFHVKNCYSVALLMELAVFHLKAAL